MDRTPTIDARGVSPVIGVVLMVAITVVLAAVTGTLVFDAAGSVGGSVHAGATVTASPEADELEIAYESAGNAAFLTVAITNASGSGDTMTFELEAVGARILLDETGNTTTGAVTDGAGDFAVADGGQYEVVVTAVDGNARAVIVSESASL